MENKQEKIILKIERSFQRSTKITEFIETWLHTIKTRRKMYGTQCCCTTRAGISKPGAFTTFKILQRENGKNQSEGSCSSVTEKD